MAVPLKLANSRPDTLHKVFLGDLFCHCKSDLSNTKEQVLISCFSKHYQFCVHKPLKRECNAKFNLFLKKL